MAVRAEELLQIRSQRRGDTVLLQLTGELDMATAPLVERAVSASMAGGIRCFRLDLTHLIFCDGAGLWALRRITNTVRAADAVFVLEGIHPNVRRTLNRLGTLSPWSPPITLD
ncbi:STAS domain-containing protein [Streptomyces sp. NPDC015127]|uniref:STAS domain-containing protein n=1 Tax=Streptomyces sp. NPDC015127 TaxID=3364939 RepID=UPI0036FC413F